MRWLFAGILLLAAHAALAQSDVDGSIEHQGAQRRYVLHLPPGAPEAGPRPLVLALHGLDREGDSAAAVRWFRAWWTMDAVADREGFAVVYPEAIAMPETMEFWRRLHGCTGEEVEAVPHRREAGRTRAALISWTGCIDGGAVQLLRIAGGGHQLPTLAPDEKPPAPGDARNHDLETGEEVWRFFQAGQLPAPGPTP